MFQQSSLSAYEKFCAGLRAELAPVGSIEQALAREIDHSCRELYYGSPTIQQRVLNIRIIHEGIETLRCLRADRALPVDKPANKVVCITSKRRPARNASAGLPPAA
jgi:hypothetical protein